MGILNTLREHLEEARTGDETTSKKGKKVSVTAGQRGREKIKVGDKEFGPDDKYTVKVKDSKGKVKEKTKNKAAKYAKYVDKKKEADKSSVKNTKDEEKAAKKASKGETKRGKKRTSKWWENEEEFKKTMGLDVSSKKKTQEAIEKIREKDEKKSKKKVKKVAESIYPADPKAIKQLVEEYFNNDKEEVRKFFI